MGLAFKISPENIMGDFGYFESWSQGTSVAPDGWIATGVSGSIAQESTIKKFGSFSAKITSGASGVYALEYNYDITTRSILTKTGLILGEVYWGGKTITYGVWVHASTASKARIYISDGTGARSDSSFHTGGGDWEFLTVERQIGTDPTELIFGCEVAATSEVAYFDGGIFSESELTFTDFRNDNVYVQERNWQPSVSFSIASFVIPRKAGSAVQDTKIKQKTLSLRVQIHDPDFETARGFYDVLIRAVSNGVKDLLFADDRLLKVRLSGVSSLKYQAEARVYTFRLKFISLSPFEQHVSRKRSSTAIVTSPQSFQIEVAGSVETFPIIRILPAGQIISSLVLDNLTTGEDFSYGENVADGGTLFIDTDTLEVLNDGLDGQSYVTGDYLKLVPGTNFLKVTGTTDHTLQIDWFDKYL